MNDLDRQQRQSLMEEDSVNSDPNLHEIAPAAGDVTTTCNDVTAPDDVTTQDGRDADPPVWRPDKPVLRSKQSILRKQKPVDENSSTEHLTDTGGIGNAPDPNAPETRKLSKRKLSKSRSESQSDDTAPKKPGQNGKCKKRDILPRKYLLSQASIKRVSEESDSPSRKRHRRPCSITCCGRSVQWPQLLTWCKCCEEKPEEDDFDIPFEEEPFRKRCSRACFTFIYIILATIAVVFTYSMVQDLITSMKNPVRSIHYNQVTDYDAPGIAVYQGGAKFLACGHYYNNVVTSKVSLTQLDLKNHTCNYTNLQYVDPHYPEIQRHVTIMRGPTSFTRREAIFLHFELEDETRDFFTVSYFVFPGYDKFVALNVSEQGSVIVDYHRVVPTFALSAGLRMWIKLIMSENHLLDGTKHTEFKVEYSVVKFHDRRPANETKRHLFFIFFEWKNDIIEQSYLIYTTTPWSIGAGLCGVFLTLHRGYQLAQTSYRRVQKDKERRSYRKRTLRELRKQKSMQEQAHPTDV